jgi:heptosyltransferase-2
MMWRGRVKQRVGYARGGRSMLLTHRVAPLPRTVARGEADRKKAEAVRVLGGGRVTVGSSYEPVPTIDFYLALANYLAPPANGAAEGGGWSRSMEVGITAQEWAEAQAVLFDCGIEDGPVAMIVPGANFGSSKCWLPERFAQVADALADPAGRYGARVLLASSPSEMPIIDAILTASAHRERLVPLAGLNEGRGVSIGALKALVKRSTLMVCNDTGPRHFAAAFGVPSVTLFGPTDPVWAETYSPRERIVRVDVPCGPCQLKACPIDHRCMKELSTEMVMAAVEALWPRTNGGPAVQLQGAPSAAGVGGTTRESSAEPRRGRDEGRGAL